MKIICSIIINHIDISLSSFSSNFFRPTDKHTIHTLNSSCSILTCTSSLFLSLCQHRLCLIHLLDSLGSYAATASLSSGLLLYHLGILVLLYLLLVAAILIVPLFGQLLLLKLEKLSSYLVWFECLALLLLNRVKGVVVFYVFLYVLFFRGCVLVLARRCVRIAIASFSLLWELFRFFVSRSLWNLGIFLLWHLWTCFLRLFLADHVFINIFGCGFLQVIKELGVILLIYLRSRVKSNTLWNGLKLVSAVVI